MSDKNSMPAAKDHRLIMTPLEKNPQLLPEQLNLDSLQTFLSNSEFIGTSRDTSSTHPAYEIGENFLHQISFLGCSPTLSGENEVFISLVQFEQAEFFNSSDMPPPRCPDCNKTDKNWPLYLQQWQLDRQQAVLCPNCQSQYNFSTMKWKKNGGYGSLIIQIHGVQEQLAVPNPQFLEHLQQRTGTDWEYFFAE